MRLYKPGRPNKYIPGNKSGCIPPHKAGEYRIRNSSGSIMYIGETNDLGRRMHEHIRSGKINIATVDRSTFEWKVADGRSSSVTRRVHEQKKIAQHNPPLNKSIGGEGRLARH